MAGHEPYVADPQEPRPRPRLLGARPLLVVLIVLLLLGAGGFLLVESRSVQDPSLDEPVPAPAEPTGT